MRAAMVVSGLLVLALAGCDSTSAGELVIAPEEPLCHPWPSCTAWTTDTVLASVPPTPDKLRDGVKTGHHALADFELSVTGESIQVALKSGGRYRLEFDGPDESLMVRTPDGHAMTLLTLGNPALADASGFRELEFRAGSGGVYEFIAGPLVDGGIRVRLYGI
jgi:hypothetical protein